MIYDNSFGLEQMLEEAQDQMAAAKKRLRSLDAALVKRLDGRNRLGLLGAVLFSVGWIAVFLVASVYLKGHLPEPLRLALLGVSLLLALSLIIDELIQISYYGSILNARTRLLQMRRRVDKAQKTLADHLETYLKRRDAQWELPLTVGSSINQTAGQISARLSGMEALSSTFLTAAKTVLYYAACVVWAAAGSYILFGLVVAFEFLEGLSPNTITIMMVASTVIACIFEALFARMIWAKTDCDVGNLTLLALALGPVIFAVVIALIWILYFVILLILYLVASIFGLGAVILPIHLQLRF